MHLEKLPGIKISLQEMSLGHQVAVTQSNYKTENLVCYKVILVWDSLTHQKSHTPPWNNTNYSQFACLEKYEGNENEIALNTLPHVTMAYDEHPCIYSLASKWKYLIKLPITPVTLILVTSLPY